MMIVIENLLYNVLGAIIFLILYEFIIKAIVGFLRNYKLRGIYIHCYKDYKPCTKDGKTGYSIIKIKFWRPNVLKIKSYNDITNDDDNQWSGEIRIGLGKIRDGYGVYCYEKGSAMGNHHVYIFNKNVIFVQVSDYRKIGDENIWIKEKEAIRKGIIISPVRDVISIANE